MAEVLMYQRVTVESAPDSLGMKTEDLLRQQVTRWLHDLQPYGVNDADICRRGRLKHSTLSDFLHGRTHTYGFDKIDGLVMAFDFYAQAHGLGPVSVSTLFEDVSTESGQKIKSDRRVQIRQRRDIDLSAQQGDSVHADSLALEARAFRSLSVEDLEDTRDRALQRAVDITRHLKHRAEVPSPEVPKPRRRRRR